MKLLLAIAVVTLLMLKTHHAHPYPSTTAEAEAEAFVKAIDQKAQVFTENMDIIVRNVLPYVPSSRAYEVHRQKLHNILQAINDYKSKAGACLEKRMLFSLAASKFMETYRVPDANATPEHKEIVKLLNERGMKALVDDLEAFALQTLNDQYGKPPGPTEAIMMNYLSTHC